MDLVFAAHTHGESMTSGKLIVEYREGAACSSRAAGERGDSGYLEHRIYWGALDLARHVSK
jgi:hypothetical protein